MKAPPFLPDGSPFRLSAVLFDFDGTLTQPGDLDFEAIRVAVGGPLGVGLLEYLDGISDPKEKRRKEAVLEEAEEEAAGKSRPNEGAAELVALLRAHHIPMAVITRNGLVPVERSLSALPGINRDDFVCIVTRDLALSPKPLPDGVLHIIDQLGVDPREVLLIGDHAFDIEAGRRAGTLTMFLQNDPAERISAMAADHIVPDFIVPDLWEAARIIRYGLPLPVGKLPSNFLQEAIGAIVLDDPTLLVGAHLGEDAAVVDAADVEALVWASDPITLASDAMARYVVLANANDVAAAGAVPRWLLTTLLFPLGSTPSEIAALMRDIETGCRLLGISLCGGHTEITDAVVRPVVVGTMAGSAIAERLLDKRRIREGDRILLTKGVAVEGTGLIAREYAPRLAAAGMSAAEIAECAAFLDNMSILEEARVASSFTGVTAVHDVTEGGLATAVRELGAAGAHRLRIDMDAIPIYPQTRRICTVMGLDPLGLIGSGSALITCSDDQTAAFMQVVAVEGIEVTVIGEVLGEGQGVEAWRHGQRVDWPSFERDEVSRLVR
ncbi:MAG: HAD family hydrolase [Thermoleophilia bacterium]|jgi:hydrogenase expression/formation protein HypE